MPGNPITDLIAPIDTNVAPTSGADRRSMDANTATAARAPEQDAADRHAPSWQGPAGWPVPEILRHARARETNDVDQSVSTVADRGAAPAAPERYAVSRGLAVAYTGDGPVAPWNAVDAVDAAPATSKRERVLSVSVDPLGIITRNYGGSIARRLGDHSAIRIDGQFNRGVEEVRNSSSWRLGVSIPLYLNETFQGPFVEAGVVAAHRLLAIGITQHAPYSAFGSRDYAAGPEIFVGWQRLFDNGLHIAAAVGATADWTADDANYLNDAVYAPPPLSTLGAAARTSAETYVRVGYAF
jgi:hypothetical protein